MANGYLIGLDIIVSLAKCILYTFPTPPPPESLTAQSRVHDFAEIYDEKKNTQRHRRDKETEGSKNTGLSYDMD